VVVVKGTFELRPDVLVPAVDQAPIELSDEYWDGEPSRSSLRCAGDVLLGRWGASPRA
jgi:hypothetical protein